MGGVGGEGAPRLDVPSSTLIFTSILLDVQQGHCRTSTGVHPLSIAAMLGQDLKQRQAAESEKQQDVIMRLSHSNSVLTDRNTHLERQLLKALQDQLTQLPSACPVSPHLTCITAAAEPYWASSSSHLLGSRGTAQTHPSCITLSAAAMLPAACAVWLCRNLRWCVSRRLCSVCSAEPLVALAGDSASGRHSPDFA